MLLFDGVRTLLHSSFLIRKLLVVDIHHFSRYSSVMENRSLSLNSYLRAAADVLGTTWEKLYERQRALVRANLLDQSQGMGPGSGVRVSPSSIAWVFVAVLCADGLAEAVKRGELIGRMKCVRGNCLVTRATSFQGALEAILSSEELASRVSRIEVSRTSPEAKIYFGWKKGSSIEQVSVFQQSSKVRPPVNVTAAIEGDVVQELFRLLERDDAYQSGANRKNLAVPRRK